MTRFKFVLDGSGGATVFATFANPADALAVKDDLEERLTLLHEGDRLFTILYGTDVAKHKLVLETAGYEVDVLDALHTVDGHICIADTHIRLADILSDIANGLDLGQLAYAHQVFRDKLVEALDQLAQTLHLIK